MKYKLQTPMQAKVMETTDLYMAIIILPLASAMEVQPLKLEVQNKALILDINKANQSKEAVRKKKEVAASEQLSVPSL